MYTGDPQLLSPKPQTLSQGRNIGKVHLIQRYSGTEEAAGELSFWNPPKEEQDCPASNSPLFAEGGEDQASFSNNVTSL